MVMGLMLALGPVTALGHSLTLLTYNVAEFSDTNRVRIDRLIRLITDLEPDIIHLQEAQQQTLKQLKTNSVIRNQYTPFHGGPPNSLPNGGLLTLTKKSLNAHRWTYITFPSDMDRGMLSVQVNLCDRPHYLVNLHLESPDMLFWRSQSLRAKQVDILGDWGRHHPDLILAGDFNTFLDQHIDQSLDRYWSDAWTLLRGGDPGLTWDPNTNLMASWHGLLRIAGARLDRVLFQSDTLLPSRITQLGMDAPEDLSDHFGLLAEFSCQRPPRP
jgi:endonuclease/exonuclease/phosphatase family metal-dependent hydrolase